MNHKNKLLLDFNSLQSPYLSPKYILEYLKFKNSLLIFPIILTVFIPFNSLPHIKLTFDTLKTTFPNPKKTPSSVKETLVRHDSSHFSMTVEKQTAKKKNPHKRRQSITVPFLPLYDTDNNIEKVQHTLSLCS